MAGQPQDTMWKTGQVVYDRDQADQNARKGILEAPNTGGVHRLQAGGEGAPYGTYETIPNSAPDTGQTQLASTSVKGVEGEQPFFADALQRMIAASGGRIYIVSGFRSHEHQTSLFENAVKKYGSPQAARHFVALPGHSNHERGLAADLGGDIELAHRLAPQFGLGFPMSWERWHIEPVGLRTGKLDTAGQILTGSPAQATNQTQDPAQSVLDQVFQEQHPKETMV